ncbi:uncharacterized protein AMSG_07199 [Thecamonas trahens ATCC 50062]|uniref:Uncharacterized protein n=1 Tax=Thecamonas trahens ATCC 50062 TaxID=461836 RepID=A0A0L0DI25_THETB|nr:hypothetical protein AMSG_07199 [Thecamonas trahens ATCC 50062]KNC50948.1 hypothetical protein AMSG_07199 [Thecamonas trahens ATCC 50062]|eukprot:XP_013756645.1 hypothetical protein AMSG_07199 [Thecamonas trahens ATCC 50062]
MAGKRRRASAKAVQAEQSASVLSKDAVDKVLLSGRSLVVDDESNTAPVVVQVAAVYKFAPTAEYGTVVGAVMPPAAPYAYDIVLSDGSHMTKVVLAPVLGKLVESGKLVRGAVVEVTELRVRYDETRVGGPGFLVLHGLNLRVSPLSDEWPVGEILVNPLVPLVYSSKASEAEQAFAPLTQVRSTYLNLDDDHSLPPGPEWQASGALDMSADEVAAFEAEIAATPLPSLAEAVTSFKSNKVGSSPLLGKVTGKQVLQYYGGPSSSARVPFKFSFVLEDLTYRIEAVVWQEACRELYADLAVGDLVVVTGYRSKKSYNYRDLWELSLNITHPAASVRRIPPGAAPSLALPRPVLDYIPLRALLHVPDGVRVDIAGIVVYVSSPRSAARHGSAPSRSLFRYVELSEGEAQLVTLKMYRAGAEELFDSIAQGDALLATSVVVSSVIPSSDDGRLLVPYGTSFSQYYSDGIGSQTIPYSISRYPGLARLFALERGLRANMMAELSLGCNPVVPHLPSYSMFQRLVPEAQAVPLQVLVSSALPTLPVHERTTVVLQGRVARIRIRNPSMVDMPSLAELAAPKSRRKTLRKSASASVSRRGTSDDDDDAAAESVGVQIVLDAEAFDAGLPHQASSVHVNSPNLPHMPYVELTVVDLNRSALIDVAIVPRVSSEAKLVDGDGFDVKLLAAALAFMPRSIHLPQLPPADDESDVASALAHFADSVRDNAYAFRVEAHSRGPWSRDGRFVEAHLVSMYDLAQLDKPAKVVSKRKKESKKASKKASKKESKKEKSKRKRKKNKSKKKVKNKGNSTRRASTRDA